MAEPVLLRTSDWMYLTTAAEDGSDRLSLRLEPHGFLGGSQDGPQQHVPWPAGASWTCGRMENGAVMIHASQTGGDSDPNERVYLALNLIVWPSAPANECLRLEAASAANAPDTSTLWRVIENGTELQSIVYSRQSPSRWSQLCRHCKRDVLLASSSGTGVLSEPIRQNSQRRDSARANELMPRWPSWSTSARSACCRTRF